ncbi:LOW QUALITY PROTEIN: rab3 GTPase-activating protein catalytic subunit-like [Pecten maximus]|uniref:LOW QUALITY PROTEIN: rab3 GTPase-activating protein catalytic subunit-like n=1 Tax=Pecten maximus TaxID=6579 RepID=UPI0014587741|nr:LOW QUALITY PROTEIN: rab3 GTPase-activating protein catalytic subunit-like [Pecten maximus]
MAADEDADVFEITDFTTASEWERFVARLEEILHEWKLVSVQPRHPVTKADQNNGTWIEKTEEITFADFKFMVSHHYLKPASSPDQTPDLRQSPDEEGEEIEEVEEKEDVIPTVMMDMMNTENDFPSKAHFLSRLYGLQEFVVIAPSSKSDAIDSESRIKLLLSSVSIALSNAGCPVPVFVQVQHFWRQMYSGICLMSGTTINFDVIQFQRVPPQYNHLAGLLDVFKAKLATQITPRPKVTVAVRFTYFLQEWVNSPWPQEPPVVDSCGNDLSSLMEDEIGCTSFNSLPFGASEDPVSELRLACTWPSLSEDMIVENQNYSDLDPLQAPQWSVKIGMSDDPNCLLGHYLQSFVKHGYRQESTEELLWNMVVTEEETDQTGDISQALQRLTEPNVGYSIPSISNVVNRASSRMTVKTGVAPISADLLTELLELLFPDAKDAFDKQKEEGEEEKEMDATEVDAPESDNRYTEVIRNLSKQLKSCPSDNLVHSLAVCLCIINISNGGLRGVAQLWQEFVLEMRFRWENKCFIKGIEPGAPNLGSCLIYQKLQMLNCCIERKMKREQLYKGYEGNLDNMFASEETKKDKGTGSADLGHAQSERRTSADSKSDQPMSSGNFKQKSVSLSSLSDKATKLAHMDVQSSSEDEFFECDEATSRKDSMELNPEDCVDDQVKRKDSWKKHLSDPDKEADECDIDSDNGQEEPGSGDSMDSNSDTAFKESFTHGPVGRLAPFGDLKLIDSEESMYIPVTQEPAPMTEDMLEEHAEILARLGTSSEGAQLRARMQSACLMSDMESFKAANPGCTLIDFVRWYSPRDWIEEEVVDDDGQVSKKCHLSPRMMIPGNIWREAWESSKAVPARRQKRLFDDTKEAEKVLHFLSSMKPANLVLNLMPVVIHSAIIKVIQNEDSDIPKLKDVLDNLISRASKVTRAAHQDIKKYEDLVRYINLAETMIARAKSLKSKFTKDLLDHKNAEKEMEQFVSELLHHQEVAVRGGPYGPAGSCIHKLFIAAQKEINMVVDDNEEKEEDGHMSSLSAFPRPVGREYILRTFCPRPAAYSKSLPHRLYCNIMEGHEFHLAGAFSTDTTFQ